MKKVITLVLIAFIAFGCGNLESARKKGEKQDSIDLEAAKKKQKTIDSLVDVAEIERLQKDSIRKVESAKEEAEFLKTKAGRIWNKHRNWSREDCERLVNREIWIGMEYDMVVYLRGKPNTINTSNYGYGNEYQCCWDDYNPSCFYMKSDNIITSYN